MWVELTVAGQATVRLEEATHGQCAACDQTRDVTAMVINFGTGEPARTMTVCGECLVTALAIRMATLAAKAAADLAGLGDDADAIARGFDLAFGDDDDFDEVEETLQRAMSPPLPAFNGPPIPDDTACVVCGCTEAAACDGGCHWLQLDPPVCSRCDPQEAPRSPSHRPA